MKPQLRVLTGHSAGLVAVFSKPQITLGRHPASDLRFDPEQELDVSARHATILRRGEHWYVRDLGSTNGTLVNGHRIAEEAKLDDTDQIRLGPQGPIVEFRLVSDATPDTVSLQRPSRAAGAVRPSVATAPEPPATQPPPASTTQRIRAEVRRQTRSLRTLTAVLFAALLVLVAGFWVANRRLERQREAEARRLQARIDSVLAASEAAVQSLKGQMAGLADALRRSQAEVERLNRDLAAARAAGNDQQVADLRTRLASAAEVLRHQQAAAQVDYSAIYQANQDAVAMIFVEFGPSEIFTGTAFALTRDGVMITNRHVVAGPDGTKRPRRIGVRFADSDQTFAARLLAISSDPAADLAVIKVEIRGGNPAVRHLGAESEVRPGDPVAIIGFPLGVELPSDRSRAGAVARTSLTAGTVSKVLADLIQVDGYGAEGSSGSPIFDREGNVVAVLYGGQPGTSGRIVFGVPAKYVAALAAPFLSGSPRD